MQFIKTENVRGCVIISTCNRMEIYLSLNSTSDCSFIEMLCSFAGVEPNTYAAYFTERTNKETVRHLFQMTAGLKSRIFGEDQIVTQVRESLEYARKLKSTDNILEVLFCQAVTSAKRIKTETVLTLADESVIHTALKKLQKDGVDINGKSCLVIGNGMMGRLAAEVLRNIGADVTVTVRQHCHKEVMIPEGCGRIAYSQRYEFIPKCSLIVSATSSPHYTIDFESFKAIEPLYTIHMIDLAVPRDIDPKLSELPNIRLYDIDSFQIVLNTDQFDEKLSKADRIIEEEQKNFYEWVQGKSHITQIETIKTAVGQDTVNRLTPVIRQLPVSDSEKAELKNSIIGACERMMNHLLFELKKELSETVDLF